MKIETKPAPPQGFVPRSLIITFESQDELDAFGHIFNHGSILTGIWDNFNDAALSGLYLEAKHLGANVSAKNDAFGYSIYQNLHEHFKREHRGLK